MQEVIYFRYTIKYYGSECGIKSLQCLLPNAGITGQSVGFCQVRMFLNQTAKNVGHLQR